MDEDVKFGSLNIGQSGRRRGRKVFEWVFQAISSKPMPVDVYVIERDEGILFEATFDLRPDPPELDQFIVSDIQLLRKRVENFLLRHAALINAAKWEDWLEVTIHGRQHEGSDGRNAMQELAIKVRPIKRAIDPVSGLPVTITGSGRVVKLDPPRSLKDFVGHAGVRFDDPREISYIRDTPENVAALKSILSRMDALRSSLAELLSQSQIEKNIPAILRDSAPLLGIK